MPDFLEIALNESQKGRRVFPCNGKMPAIQGGHGVLDATNREDVITDWSGIFPEANVGIGFFDDSTEVGVDIDVKNIPQWREYEVKFGPPNTRTVRTGGGGYHYYFKRPEGLKLPNIPQAAGKGFELKSNGTYLIAPGSIHPETKKQYELIKDIEPEPMPEWLIKVCLNGAYTEKKTELAAGKIPRGQHDQFLTSQAGSYRRRGDDKETIKAKLRIDLDKLDDVDPSQPYTEKDIERIAKSVGRYNPENATPDSVPPYLKPLYSIYVRDTPNAGTNATPNATENATPLQDLSSQIEEWIRDTKGRWFETQDLDRDLSIASEKNKNTRRQKFLRLESSNIIERHPTQNKRWRFVDRQLEELNYKSLEVTHPLPIVMPLGLTQLVNLHQGNLVVFAGTTNAGKTALALEVVLLNNNGEMPVYYFYSEGGANELRDRLDKKEDMSIEEWNFKLFSRSTNFADVIAPDCINVIDYLELTGDFWEVNRHLTDICNKIGKGLAVVCIQKKKDATFARGGEFSAEKARLYLALDEAEGRNNARVRIIKGKSWAVKGYNPNGLQATFHIENGWIVENEVEWDYEKKA